MRRTRTRWGVLGAALLVLALPACSGSDSDADSGPDAAPGDGAAVLEALERVRFTERRPEGVTYVDAVRANELLAADAERFAYVRELATPPLMSYTVPEHRFGLDPARTESAVTVGFSDSWGVWRGGYDPAAVAADLEADGFTGEESGGVTVWTSPEGGLSLRIAEDEIVWGTDGAAPPGEEDGEPLSGVPEYAALSDCLGEVYRADFVEGGAEDTVRLYAVGLRASSPEETSSVLCALTGSSEGATDTADRLREAAGEDGETYGGSEVAVLEGEFPGVRMTVPDSGPRQLPGRLLSNDIELTMLLAQL